jgi:hypothetical protein
MGSCVLLPVLLSVSLSLLSVFISGTLKGSDKNWCALTRGNSHDFFYGPSLRNPVVEQVFASEPLLIPPFLFTTISFAMIKDSSSVSF